MLRQEGVGGLAGTAIMTMMMYIAPRMGMPKMDMPRMLGTMFISKEGSATALGMVIHLMMGAIFAIIYAWLWSLGLGSATWWWGLIFGAVHGIVAVVMMPVMLRMHPRPPDMSFGGVDDRGRVDGPPDLWAGGGVGVRSLLARKLGTTGLASARPHMF